MKKFLDSTVIEREGDLSCTSHQLLNIDVTVYSTDKSLDCPFAKGPKLLNIKLLKIINISVVFKSFLEKRLKKGEIRFRKSFQEGTPYTHIA